MRAKLAGVCLFAAALALATWAPAQDGTPTTITDIRQESTDRSTRLVVECTGPLAYTYYSPDPLTLVVDIPEVDASQVPARINVGTREVESLRVTSLARADGRNLARVEVRLASLVPVPDLLEGQGAQPGLRAARDAWPSAAGPRGPRRRRPPWRPSRAPAAAPEPAPARRPEPRRSPRGARSRLPTEPRATRILAVSRDEVGGHARLHGARRTAGSSTRTSSCPNPDRLVVDFADVTARASVRSIEVGENPVRKVRLGQFSADVAEGGAPGGRPDREGPLPDHRGHRRRAHRVRRGGRAAAARARARSPRCARRSPEPTPEPGPGGRVPARRPGGPRAAGAAAAARAADARATADDLPPMPEQSNIGQACGRPAISARRSAWTSRTATCRTSSASSPTSPGLNVVVNPGVTGKVTLKLNEVPWGRALELILKTNGLGCVLEDNVIRIARLTDLQSEEDERRKLQEEKALAGDLDRLHASASPTRRRTTLAGRAEEGGRPLRARPDQRRRRGPTRSSSATSRPSSTRPRS